LNLFKKKNYIPLKIIPPVAEASVPDGLWIKCPACARTIYAKQMDALKLCTLCGAGFRLSARERINITVDDGSFVETDKGLLTKNPLAYPGYEAKIAALTEKTGLNEAVATGRCCLGGFDTVLCVMDTGFIMASMGSVVGEKITRAFEYAAENKLPVIIFAASGGARMQEGIISLMQMAKTSAAAKRHSEKGLLYVTVLTDPTTGGVTASFAMLGDIILAEPRAVIGFAGRRVIEQTIKQRLPEDFQTAEFMLEHGFIDKIVTRENMRKTLIHILRLHEKGGAEPNA